MQIHTSFLLRRILFVAQFFLCLLLGSTRTTEEGVPGNKYDGSEPTISYFSCHGRYISKSYFTAYDTLQDSTFHDFIARLLKGTTAQASATVLDIHRQLLGEGSHRRLSSYLKYSIDPDSTSDMSEKQCEIIIIEKLPAGVFADPFEYQHLLQRNVFKDAAVFGDTNLELPSFLSSRSIVEVHLTAVLNVTADQKVFGETKIEIPIHARYPPLKKGGYMRIEFGAPDLLLRCGVEGQQYSQNCSLTLITGGADIEHDIVQWSVPAGIETHASLVSVVTFLSAILSAVLIIITSLRHSSIGSDKIVKQS